MFKKTAKNAKDESEERTKTAKTETTTTTVQTGTFFNEKSRTITFETTRQTEIHTQQSRLSETVSQQAITPQELNEFLLKSKQFNDKSTFPSYKFPTILQTEETITQNRGSKVTSNIEEQRIKLNSNTSSPQFNTFKTLNDSPLKKSTFQYDARPFAQSSTTTNFPQFNQPTYERRSLGANPKSLATPNLSSIKTQQKSKLKPGIAYIINNQYFDNPKSENRYGSEADVESLMKTFKMLQLTVELYEDPTLNKIKSTVKTIASKDFTKHSCLVIAILSHGNRFETIQAKDKSYSIDDDVLFPITNNPTLRDKPKIFFIQACKGSREVGDFPTDTTQISGIPAEILKCYSTFEGYVSYRTSQGSFFIQKLCENLQRDGRTKCIETIIKDVTASVKNLTGRKQIPTMTVNLTKPYVFGDYMKE